MPVVVSNSPADTEAFGARVAQVVGPGWVVGLDGDLGAGKTAFVRGLVRGLGSTARVHSPTFALLNQYRGGRLEVLHLDLYRLNSAEDLHAAGLTEHLLRPEGIAVVEWFSRAAMPDRPGLHRLLFRWTGEDTREIDHDLPGL
jgi:tRNA threonylcarbamoyladenosine biosynthesis protein TsaE